jgi:hypothetical protein
MPAAAQGRVFQDVGDAGRVLRYGQEGHQEGVVVVGGGQMDVSGTGDAVAVFLDREAQRRHALGAQQFESGMGHAVAVALGMRVMASLAGGWEAAGRPAQRRR